MTDVTSTENMYPQYIYLIRFDAYDLDLFYHEEF